MALCFACPSGTAVGTRFSRVYDDPECFASGLTDHTLLVVGYVLSASTPYWIAKNSWGARWGDGGYVSIAIQGGAGICGINSQPGVYPVVKCE
eukprot:jgi/Mesen1/2731/ME000168S01799